MDEILQGILKALELIITLDPEVVDTTSRTLMISISSTLLASLIAVPIGAIIHFKHFKGKRAIINIIQTLYSIPTVLIGLLVFLLISRSGPLGSLNLLFTPWGMILAQAILILPLIMGFSITALKGVGEEIIDLARSLGATEYQTLFTLVSEARYGIMAAIILGFGRAISEVGIAIMIGGNIRGYTRVITSAMALETSKGNLELSIALGIILLAISLIINTLLNYFQEK
ncbi:MAG TPA: ABC transporter permease [Methanothermobacter sp.]|uniref:ABC transporter permease n=1 Tax=Methanothermobacter tenebrarum TaxID=680118 RepID=A0ABM7YDU8_9EURY|nr:ABC transporter permease [Methanothermobacter tenebrarum]MBK6586685.1 ABC transporter permease [Coprothermobacter sp.]MDI6881279.1 ABC transporter permease [Methanothermobacter sp.]MDX9693186.1 ABC transporter permease [Methanothermobacter sp.]BDH79554.1 ABC transporter permease [Methanothermobacter tenebrarum]HHW15818.1 ABC transporter permease [Methanothermobacter sp.]